MILGVLGLSVPGAVGQVAESGRGERIAFVSDRDGGNDVYVMDADGDNVDRLTQGADAADVAFSPDGTLLAFSSRVDGNIYVVQPDGLGLRAITSNGATNRSPAFSPDGTRIAFSALVANNTDVYTTDLFGLDVRRLTTNLRDDFSPSFSPDGSKIAFSSPRLGAHDIWVMNTDGTNQTRITSDPTLETGPVFSPDGTRIVFAAQVNTGEPIHVVVTNTNGSDRQILVPGARADQAPTFAPDGSVVFQAGDTGDRDGPFSLARVNADGTGFQILTDTTANELEPSVAIADLDEAELAVIDEVRGARDAVNGHTDEVAAGLSTQLGALDTDVGNVSEQVSVLDAEVRQRLDDLRERVGDDTWALCVGGSTRHTASADSQTYASLLSPTAQTVQVRYLTNRGVHVQQVELVADRQTTIDVNELLTGPTGPFAGRRDVDVSIEVTGAAPAYLACSLYFDKVAGDAGEVSGAIQLQVHTH